MNQTECTVQATNNSFDDQVVTLDSTLPANMAVVSGSVNGATQVGPRKVHAEATLAGAAPGVPSRWVRPGLGYFGLGQLGVPVTPIGDEEIINLTTPSYEFAGQAWDQIGIDSNGYLIVGGGSSQDNECCTLPAGPDPARPNNILAPFWTDLDGTTAPGVLFSVLTDGINDWLVIEYQVDVFGTTDLRTFQVWIGLNGVEDIAYEYAANQTDPDGQDYLVGAENHPRRQGTWRRSSRPLLVSWSLRVIATPGRRRLLLLPGPRHQRGLRRHGHGDEGEPGTWGDGGQDPADGGAQAALIRISLSSSPASSARPGYSTNVLIVGRVARAGNERARVETTGLARY